MRSNQSSDGLVYRFMAGTHEQEGNDLVSKEIAYVAEMGTTSSFLRFLKSEF